MYFVILCGGACGDAAGVAAGGVCCMNAEAAGAPAFVAPHGASEKARTRAARIRRDEFILPLRKQSETPSRKTNGGSMAIPPTGRKALLIGCIRAIPQLEKCSATSRPRGVLPRRGSKRADNLY